MFQAALEIPVFAEIGEGNIGGVGAIRRVGKFFRHGERNFIGEATLDADRENAIKTARTVARGAKENALAIAAPADDLIVVRMRSEALGHATDGGDDVDVYVAIVFGGEGDERAIGGEVGIRFDADVAGETAGVATTAIYNPKVAAVTESDLSAADGGFVEEQSFVGGLCVRERNAEKESEYQQSAF